MMNKHIDDIVTAWAIYANTIGDWQELVKNIDPKPTGCGPVYELPDPIGRPSESFAIADMRALKYTDPHYHTNGEVEIYIVLTGRGTVVVGGKETKLTPGVISVTPPDTAHFTIPAKNLVLAVINTPPFNPTNTVTVTTTNMTVGFDKQQFDRLTL